MKKIFLFILGLGLTVGLFSGCFNSILPGVSSSNGGDSQDSSSVQTESSQDSSSTQTQTFTVVFHEEGKTDIVREVKEGEDLKNIPTPTPKTGYTVTWSVTDFTNITENIIVERVETANKYTVTYDAGEGTASVATQEVTYDQAPGSFATATREGYSFICWNYEGKAVQATELWKIDGDATLVAEWAPIVKYMVSFVQDGAETVSIEVEEGTFVAQKDIPTPQDKVGYTIAWEEIDLTNVKGDITVNAIATPNKYTITYDANEGTASVQTQTVTYDKAPESFATATRKGYSFICWKYEGKAVLATELWKIANDVTLVAEWVPTSMYTVTFIQDGYDTITLTATDGDSIDERDIPAPQDKVGYTVAWEEKDLTNITDNITVNAIATPNKYTITYDAGEGTVTPTTQVVTYDKAPESFAVPTREGYNFVCWRYEGKAVLATELWKIADNVTLIAEWSAVGKYTVSFVQADEETISITVEEGDSIDEKDIPAPQDKVGYTVAWEEKDLTNITNNITVNAIATPNKYTITYDAGEGTVTSATQEVTYDKAPESFAVPTRDGYKFKGWAYNGTVLLESALWAIDSDVTLTALWAKTYTLTLDADGGTLDTTTITVVEDEAYRLPQPTQEGKSFMGWYYGSTKIVDVGVWELFVDGSEIVLKAEWGESEWTNNY